MGDLPQCGGCRPPSDYYCEYRCPVFVKYKDEEEH
jgi:hypothetical protein